MAVIFLPWFSLLISLPAMLTVKVFLDHNDGILAGQMIRTELVSQCKFPVPPVRAKLYFRNRLTGVSVTAEAGEEIPTAHCGAVEVTAKKLWVYDYLGLFRRRIRMQKQWLVHVEPVPLRSKVPLPTQQQLVTRWKPKLGGGFSENHDLRPYRPGDDLRHIHWKMTAKTGKLVYREPVEPVQKEVLLIMTLSGIPEVLDRKLGRYLWVSRELLARNIAHRVCCRTGSGDLELSVTDPASQRAALHILLEGTLTRGKWIPEGNNDSCLYVIGGEPDDGE